MLPSLPHTTLISFTHAPWMPLTDSAALDRPRLTASSTLVEEEALSSMTLATDMFDSSMCVGPAARPEPGSMHADS